MSQQTPPESPGDPNANQPSQPPPDQVRFGPQGQGYPPPQGPNAYGQPAHGYGEPQGPTGPYGGGYGPYDTEPPRKRRGLKAVIIAAVMTVLLGGGAFAFVKADPLHLFSAGPQAAEAIPSNAFAYVGVDLDPSAEQKVAALRFLNRFPSFEKEFNLGARDDIREKVFKELLSEFNCGEVNYDKDIKPWIGEQMGFAAVGGDAEGDEPTPIIAVESHDEAAAKAGLGKLKDCQQDQDVAWAFTGDYVLLSDSQQHADAAVKGVEQGSLADAVQFKADMDALGDTGVATVWFDVESMLGQIKGLVDDAPISLDSVKNQRVAATFRFQSDSAEIAAVVFGSPTKFEDADNPIVELPASTAVALGLTNGADQVDEGWRQFREQGEATGFNLDELATELRNETGLNVPEDLKVLFGSKFLLAMDGKGVREAFAAEDPNLFRIGLVSFTDVAAFNELWDRVGTLIEKNMGAANPLVKKEFDEGVAVSLNEEHVEELAKLDGDLGGEGAFRSVVENGSRSPFVIYVNVDQLEPLFEDESDAADLTPMRAFGLSVWQDGDYARMSAKLSLN